MNDASKACTKCGAHPPSGSQYWCKYCWRAYREGHREEINSRRASQRPSRATDLKSLRCPFEIRVERESLQRQLAAINQVIRETRAAIKAQKLASPEWRAQQQEWARRKRRSRVARLSNTYVKSKLSQSTGIPMRAIPVDVLPLARNYLITRRIVRALTNHVEGKNHE